MNRNIIKLQQENISRLLESDNNSVPAFLNRYANGGLIQNEQTAVIGERNNPELVLPLTNPNRVINLLEEASENPSTSREVAQILNPRYLFTQAVNRVQTSNLPEVVRDIIKDKTYNLPVSERDPLDFNPFNITDNMGKLESYDSMDSGISAFITQLESILDKFNSMSYKEQLEDLRDRHIIDQIEYNRIIEQNQNKLVDSLDELNKSVQESNRLSRSSRNIPNVNTFSGRRYI